MSNSCGTPMVDLNVFGTGFFICNNGFGQDMINAWLERVNGLEKNLTPNEIQALQNVLKITWSGTSYYDQLMYYTQNITLWMGHLPDSPAPDYWLDNLNRSWTALLPKSWLQNKAASLSLMLDWITNATYQ